MPPALQRGPGKCLDQEFAHHAITNTSGFLPDHDADQVLSVASYTGRDVEARGTRVSRLDTIGSREPTKQPVMILVTSATISKPTLREPSIFPREMILQGQAQSRHIARRRELVLVRKPRRVLEDGIFHVQPARLGRHHAGERVLAASNMLRDGGRDVIGGFRNQRRDGFTHGDCLSGLQAQLRRLLACGPLGKPYRRRQLQASLLKALEHQIERHHLGQRGRIALAVGGLRIQCLAGISIDHNGRRRLPGDRTRNGQACERHEGNKDHETAASANRIRTRQTRPHLPIAGPPHKRGLPVTSASVPLAQLTRRYRRYCGVDQNFLWLDSPLVTTCKLPQSGFSTLKISARIKAKFELVR